MLKQQARIDLQRRPLGGIPVKIISPARAVVKTRVNSLPLTKAIRKKPIKMTVEIVMREEDGERENPGEIGEERKNPGEISERP